MYDQQIGKMFTLGSETSLNPDWWGGEPVSRNTYTLERYKAQNVQFIGGLKH